jgi:hypothetical protein
MNEYRVALPHNNTPTTLSFSPHHRNPSSKWPPLARSTRTIQVRLLNGIVSRGVMLINHGPGHITPQPSSASCRRPANSRMTQAPSIPPLHSRSVLLRRFPYPITIQRRCCTRILTHPSFSFRARALGRHFCVYFLVTLYRGDVFNCSYSIYVGP